MTSKSHQPIIFAKFVDQDILAEMGRLLFYTLNIFALNGYHIKLFQNINFEKLEKDRPRPANAGRGRWVGEILETVKVNQ